MRLVQFTAYQMTDLVGEHLPYDTISLSDLLTEYGFTYTISADSKVSELFQKVFNRYSDYYLFELPTNEGDETIVLQKFRTWLGKFLNFYENTKVYYETLLGAYETKLATIMADIEATTENEVIFNDTPQVENGVLKGDDYATTYTKTASSTKSPMKTPIERLKDIQDSLRNIFYEWTTKANMLFIEKQEGRIFK